MSTTRAELESAVVAAALAEREADLRRHPGSDCVAHYAANVAWYKASDAYHVAVDALLAFRGEEANENAEMRARLKAGLAAVMELARLVEEAGDE